MDDQLPESYRDAWWEEKPSRLSEDVMSFGVLAFVLTVMAFLARIGYLCGFFG
jgi:hypothetical protein